MNNRGTSVLSSNFIREISNIFQWQWILRSPSGEINDFNKSAEHKSKGSDIKHSKLIHKMHSNKLVVAHLNISSISNKFEALIQDVRGHVDLLMISETKFDESFPKSQFLIKGFGDPFRIDRNIHGGGILFYVREDKTAKILPREPIPSGCFFVMLNLRKRN